MSTQIDTENLIFSSYNYGRIEHVECTLEEAEAILSELQCHEGYEDDFDSGDMIDVWGVCHTQQGEGTWRINLEIV